MIDVAEADGEAYLGIASLGFDSDANRIANESRVIRGNLVYLYSALRALASWRCASFTVTVDGERTSCAATRWPWPTRRRTAAACTSRPTPSWTTACWTWSPSPRSRGCGSWPTCRSVFRGKHVNDPIVFTRRGSRGQRRRRAPLPRIRRRRPDRRRARDDDRGQALPARGRPGVSPSLTRGAARTVRSLSRRLGRGGGTTLPGRLLLRADPDAMQVDGAPSWTRVRR